MFGGEDQSFKKFLLKTSSLFNMFPKKKFYFTRERGIKARSKPIILEICA